MSLTRQPRSDRRAGRWPPARIIGFVKAGKLRDEIFDEQFRCRDGSSDRWGKRYRRGASTFRGPGSHEPGRKSVAASGIDPSRNSRSCHSPGGNEKPDLYAAAGCTKVRTYNALPNALPRYRTAAKDICYPLERFRFASGLRPGGGNFSVAATATSFSLRSSLPSSWWLPSRSSLPSSLSWPCRPLSKYRSVNLRTPCIDLRNNETISQMQN
jgi:hypothetical protein